RLPAFVRVVDAQLECVQPLREVGSVSGTQLRELPLDLDGDANGVRGIEPVVRIAERMHVAHRTIDGAGGTIEDRDARRDMELAGLSGTNAVVAALIEERRKPADLELEPDDFEQIGVAEQQQVARLRLDEVRIL